MDTIEVIEISHWAGSVTKEERAQLLGQQGLTIWLTGLSASGKVYICSIVICFLIFTFVSEHYRLCARAAFTTSEAVCVSTGWR